MTNFLCNGTSLRDFVLCSVELHLMVRKLNTWASQVPVSSASQNTLNSGNKWNCPYSLVDNHCASCTHILTSVYSSTWLTTDLQWCKGHCYLQTHPWEHFQGGLNEEGMLTPSVHVTSPWTLDLDWMKRESLWSPNDVPSPPPDPTVSETPAAMSSLPWWVTPSNYKSNPTLFFLAALIRYFFSPRKVIIDTFNLQRNYEISFQ